MCCNFSFGDPRSPLKGPVSHLSEPDHARREGRQLSVKPSVHNARPLGDLIRSIRGAAVGARALPHLGERRGDVCLKQAGHPRAIMRTIEPVLYIPAHGQITTPI